MSPAAPSPIIVPQSTSGVALRGREERQADEIDQRETVVEHGLTEDDGEHVRQHVSQSDRDRPKALNPIRCDIRAHFLSDDQRSRQPRDTWSESDRYRDGRHPGFLPKIAIARIASNSEGNASTDSMSRLQQRIDPAAAPSGDKAEEHPRTVETRTTTSAARVRVSCR